jgi:hypothetical protein
LRIGKHGQAPITVYQHTGDPHHPQELVITKENRDITPLDSIPVRGVSVADPSKPPQVEVSMWVGEDGMLEAEAHVEGHDRPFRLQHRYRI